MFRIEFPWHPRRYIGIETDRHRVAGGHLHAASGNGPLRRAVKPRYLAKHPIKRNRREAERKHSGRHQSHDDSAGSFFLHQRRHQRPPIFARAIRKKRMANATSNNPVTRDRDCWRALIRSEEHTSELQSLMRISYAVFCLKKKKTPREQKRNILQSKH